MLHYLLYPKLMQILLMMGEVKQHTNANTMNAGTQAIQKIIQTTQLQESIKFSNKINLLKEKREPNNINYIKGEGLYLLDLLKK
tara:strand:+ start:342 stop:593 length:252 start_codon:yes stop_codon:yes gene_type:complete